MDKATAVEAQTTERRPSALHYYGVGRRWLPLVLAAALLLVVALLAVSVGSVTIPVGTAASILASRLPGVSAPALWQPGWETILLEVRLPRVVLAALVGASLSLSGATYQGLFRNPLADPYLLGVASGAGLGATVALTGQWDANWLGLGAVPLAAFAGALLASAAIYLLARVGRTTPVTTLILAGVAVGALASSATTFLMYGSGSRVAHVVFWLIGSLSLANWPQVVSIAPYVAAGAIVILLFARRLNVMQLDEEQARQLGINVERTKLALVCAASVMTAAAVSVSGIIGFVGLIMPHVVRLIWGPDYRFLLPMSLLTGASFMVLADIPARTLFSPTELPVGVVTAFCGAPFFLYLLRRRKGMEL